MSRGRGGGRGKSSVSLAGGRKDVLYAEESQEAGPRVVFPRQGMGKVAWEKRQEAGASLPCGDGKGFAGTVFLWQASLLHDVQCAYVSHCLSVSGSQPRGLPCVPGGL